MCNDRRYKDWTLRHANWGFVTRKSFQLDKGRGAMAVGEGSPISLARVYVFSIPLVDNGSNGEGNEVSRFQIRSFAPRVSGLIA